jgi:uncharacterized protein (DUF885 family)
MLESTPPHPALQAFSPGLCSASCLLLAMLGSSGCGGPPSDAKAPAALASENAAAETAESAPKATPENIARRLLALQPGFARAVGLHEFDGKLADYSAAGIERRIQTLTELKSEVAALVERAQDADERLDWSMLNQIIAQDLFDLTEVESFRTRPAFYSELFSVEEYIVREYAPLEQRARAMLEHLRASSQQLANVDKNLRSPLSQPVVKTAVDIFKGFGTYLRGDVQIFLDGVADPLVKQEAKALAASVAGEADKLATRLAQVELPKADQSHILGRARYEHLLLAQEALTTPIEQLEEMAEKDLQRNKAAYEALAKTVVRVRPKASDLMDEVRKVVDEARRFMVDEKIATLPVEPHVIVKETPPYMRWNSAFLSAGGPLDPPNLAAYYYVTLPDPTWPLKEREEYVMSRGEIVSVSTHEVFPGHYLQSLWQRNAPTFVQKIAWSYSFGEGWAHYVEQMMIEQGFAANLPEARLGQVSDALLRDCRFVASIALHVHGKSVDDVKNRFIQDCKQDEATARQQAIRGTFDPGYFAYTLGKLQILALREEAKQKLGDRFDLQKFHDALLSHGSSQLPLIHDRVLAALD